MSDVRARLLRMLRVAGTTNLPALVPLMQRDGMSEEDIGRFLHTFNVTAFTAVEEQEQPGTSDVEGPG